MTEEDRVTLDKAMDFLASSPPTHGETVEGPENSGSSGSSTPGPAEKEQSFSPLWPGGQFGKAGGRKEGDSGFISPDGATNHGANPFYHQGQGETGESVHHHPEISTGCPNKRGNKKICKNPKFSYFFSNLSNVKNFEGQRFLLRA